MEPHNAHVGTSDPFLSKHSLRRQDTPSTICDEQELEIHGAIDSRSKLGVARSSTRTISKGITEIEFKSYIREPFRFPSVSRQPSTATPVCIICRGPMQAGQICRELKGCGHCFHSSCVETHFRSHSRCPVCRFKCKPRKEKNERRELGNQLSSRQRPLWTPDYDLELLLLSDKVDRERRHKIFLLKGRRDHAPQSYIFLKSTLPTVLEESLEALEGDDGTLLSLRRHLYRERESLKFKDIKAWTVDMKKIGITFMYSVCCLYAEQLKFVDQFIKREIFEKHSSFSNRDH